MRIGLLAAALATIAAAPPPADLIVLGARIHTVDDARPEASALASRGGRIVYVGDDAGAMAFRGAGTRVERLGGRRVLPGLVDAHVHPLGLVDTGGCDLKSEAMPLARIRAVVAGCLVAQKLAPGAWLKVAQWSFSNGNEPDPANSTLRAALDAAAPHNPVALLGNDGHHGGFNSAALALAHTPDGKRIGLTRATLAGPFAAYRLLVGVGADGEPTGGVGEEARGLMGDGGLDLADRAAVMRAPERVMHVLAASGITAFLDAAAEPADTVFYDTLLARGHFTARATLAQFYDPSATRRADGSVDYNRMVRAAEATRAHFAGSVLVRADAIKLFADGVLEGNPLVTPPTLPNSPSLRPYLQPRFGRDAAGKATLIGYADPDTPQCRAAGVADAAAFTAKFGYDPAQCSTASGKLQHERPIIMEYVRRMHRAGFQLHIHAIGDAAVRAAIDAIEATRLTDGEHPPVARADTLAHLQLVSPEDVARIGRAHLFLAFTYAWAYTDPEYDLSVIPFVERVRDGSYAGLHDPAGYYERQAYPAASLQRAGGVLVAGSDAPVETRDPRPFVNMQSAVTRARDGTPALGPQERITIGEAIRAYTLDGARSIGRADEIGSIAVGKSADFIVVDRDVLAVPPGEIGATRVLATWFMGRPVYTAPR